MSVWKGGVWASQKGINAVGPWKGSLWRSERSLTSLGIKKLLFGQGQQGVMYVPQPIVDGQQVLFQDSAGTTPVTTDGQPVGLMLDLHKGLVRGPDRVTNGTFDTDTDWAKAAGVTISGGGANFSSVSTSAALSQNAFSSVTEGKSHLVEFEITSVSSGSVGPRLGSAGSTVPKYFSSVGVHSVILREGAVLNELLIFAASGFTGTIDNISIKELPGNHATQSTAAAKPLYRTDGTLHWLEGDGVDDVFIVPGSKTSLSFLTDGTGASLLAVFDKSWRDNNTDLLLGTAFYSSFAKGLDIFIDDRDIILAVYRYRHVNPDDTAGNVAGLDNAVSFIQPTIFEYQQDGSGQAWSTSEGVSASVGLVTAPTDNDLRIFGLPNTNGQTAESVVSPGTTKCFGVIITSDRLNDLSEPRQYLANLAGVTL